tara:strand:- start:796 stop:1122 length:327 start_codon:yes stop_codon:yes gene_type:complete
MKTFNILLLCFTSLVAEAQNLKSDILYADPAHERQVLDIYSTKDAKNLPVVFWIHGGGWVTGDKSDVALKPKVFAEAAFVEKLFSHDFRFGSKLPSYMDAETVYDVGG